MKKIFMTLMAATLCLAMVSSCEKTPAGNSNQEQEQEQEQPEEQPEEQPTTPQEAPNLWASMTKTMEFYYATGESWTLIEQGIGFEENDGTYTISLPVATWFKWQAQVKFLTDMTSSADKKYDFSCSLTSTTNIAAPTVKLVQTGNDGVFFFEETPALTAGEKLNFEKVALDGIDMAAITLVLDFGGCSENTVVTLTDVVFKEHKE